MFTFLFLAGVVGLLVALVSHIGDDVGVAIPVGDVSNESLMDLWNTTTRSLDKGNLDVVLDHNAYDFMDTVLREDKIEEQGVAIQGRIKLDPAGNAAFVDLYEPAQPNVVQTTYPFAIPWRHIRGQFSTERHELLMNAGSDVRLYDYAKLKRLEGLLDICNVIEESFWADAPASPTDKALWGIKVWCGKYEDTVDGAGYYGGLPNSGWSTIAGIAPSTSGDGASTIAGGHAKWRNFCAGYKAINAHFVDQMALTYKRMRFKAPLLAAQLLQAPYDRYRIFCNVTSALAAESYQRKRGDDNSPDFLWNTGKPTFRGIPLMDTDCLDADADDPFYFTNRDKFKPVVLVGDNLRVDDPIRDVAQSDVFTTFIWLTVNLKCTNRREGVACVNKY